MKKIFALVLAALLVLGSFAALADEKNDYKLTINKTVENHTYGLYQIFKGTKADHEANNDSLGDVEWGASIKDAGKKALYTAYNMTVADADIDKTANILALMKKIAEYTGDDVDSESDRAVKFANVFFTTNTNGSVTKNSNYLNDAIASQKATGTSVVFANLAAGYYLVDDAYTAGEGEILGKDYSIARIAVQVVGDTTINNKADKPTLDKVIEGAQEEDATTTNDVHGDTVGIGGKVPYKLTSKVPEMAGYEKYFYIVNDTMSEGLTFNNDVTITVGGKTLEATNDKTLGTGEKYYVETTTDESNNTKIKIVFVNFLQYENLVGQDIVIKYSATVNEKAKVNEVSNPNTAQLVYSNNPLDDQNGEGTPNEPKPGNVTGITPEVHTDTFATVLKIKKIDGADHSKTLTGAKFKVTGTKHETALVNSEKFVVDAEGTYYMLKDGTYTETEPVTTEEGYTADKYDDPSGTTMFKKITTIDKTTVGTTSTFEAIGYVDSTGVLTLTGLSEGEYEIEELIAPSGYNLLTDKIKVRLAYTYNPEARTITWNAPEKLSDNSTTNPVHYNSTAKCFEIDIENNKGTELPETGGMGTTIFYIGGSVLALLAVILLVTKRRMNANND